MIKRGWAWFCRVNFIFFFSYKKIPMKKLNINQDRAEKISAAFHCLKYSDCTTVPRFPSNEEGCDLSLTMIMLKMIPDAFWYFSVGSNGKKMQVKASEENQSSTLNCRSCYLNERESLCRTIVLTTLISSCCFHYW